MNARAVTDACFHCGEPLLGSLLTARIAGRDEPVCCQGCLAVAELIGDAGLSDYYRFRTAAGVRPDSPTGPDRWSVYGDPQIAAPFIRSSGDEDSATLAIDGLRCAACAWLIERVLQGRHGVVEATANAATGRLLVTWRRAELDLSQVLRTIAQLGYLPHPLSAQGTADLQQAERRDALRRLAVAGLGMMQVMMFAVGEYAAQFTGEVIQPDIHSLFRLVSLLIATPVIGYAAAPVFAGAVRSLRLGAINMDVPVGIALGLAYVASVWNALVAHGEVYFDSITMFVFFLTLARFVQMSVRHRTTDLADALARQVPAHAHRVGANGLEAVPPGALCVGDVVWVRTGEIFPADGEILDGEAQIDEALLTGESLPVRRRVGDPVRAGTQNVGDPVKARVTAVAGATVLSHMVQLLQRAQTRKPAIARAADAAAARFLTFVLLGAGVTCGAWLAIDPARAFEATLAVLVVACPCAFAIAMPAALSAATARLASQGVLVTNPDAIEALARIDRAVFDKTGTLTRGAVSVGRCVPLADLSPEHCLEIAAALELSSEHPLARAFAAVPVTEPACEVRVVAGAGVEGLVGGRRYRIGTPEFVADLRGEAVAPDTPAGLTGTVVALGDEQRALALIELHDVMRDDAPAAVAALRAAGVESQILSGDSHEAVAAVAAQSGIRTHYARRTAWQKVAHVERLQRAGHRVAMIGDGINDAPALGTANVSIAMGGGSALAHASADMALVGEHLESLAGAVAIARRTLRIGRQNLIWAVTYNFGCLPLAALGFIPPWLAALGMSASSIGVILNTMRLLPDRKVRNGTDRLRPATQPPALASPSALRGAA